MYVPNFPLYLFLSFLSKFFHSSFPSFLCLFNIYFSGFSFFFLFSFVSLSVLSTLYFLSVSTVVSFTANPLYLYIYKCAGQRNIPPHLSTPRRFPLNSRHTEDPIPDVPTVNIQTKCSFLTKIIMCYYKPLNFSPQNALWRPKAEGSKCF
jgi:hypothetical protein